MSASKLKPAAGQVKRISPYPFEVSLTKAENPTTLHAQIVRLTDLGFMMKVDGSQFYKVGEDYQVFFELPVVGGNVSSSAKVVKTYDAMEVVNGTQMKNRIIELHFKNLAVAARSNINSYLVKSGQKK